MLLLKLETNLKKKNSFFLLRKDMTTIGDTFNHILNDYTEIYHYNKDFLKKVRKFKNMSDDELNSFKLSLNPRLLINSKRSTYNFYPFFYTLGEKHNIAILLTAKTDNQNAELRKLTEQNPAYIFQVSGRHCDIVTSIYESLYETFDYIFLRLSYKLLTEINTNSLFMIVFHQLHKNYDKISDAINNTDFWERDSVREEAFYDVFEKCINIYVIIKT